MSVEVEYRIGGKPAQVMRGFLCDDQHEGLIGLVLNPRAVSDPTACRWQMRLKFVRRISALQEVCV